MQLVFLLAFVYSFLIWIPVAILLIGARQCRKRSEKGKPINITILLFGLLEASVIVSYLLVFWNSWFVEESFPFLEIIFGAIGFVLYGLPIAIPIAIVILRKRFSENERKTRKLTIVLLVAEILLVILWSILISSTVSGIPFELRDLNLIT